ncbi:DUF6314 family protein [Amaricoccus sp.]
MAFAGLWRIERRIDDLRAGAEGAFRGEARFRPASGGLDYAETGTLRLGTAPPLTASRSYFWREGVGDMIEVRFQDGRFFHRFAADDPTPSAEHSCDPDQYAVRYDFRRWPNWRAEWRVVGPRKDYAMVTDYGPAGQGGAFGA